MSDMKKFGIKKLDYEYIKNNIENFSNFINRQLEYYCNWQKTAEEGYRFIPKRYLISVKTASEMYNWTAEQIHRNPLIVYSRKVKPQISKIIQTIIMNVIDPSKANGKHPLQCSEKNPSPEPD
jgi:phytoene synthase